MKFSDGKISVRKQTPSVQTFLLHNFCLLTFLLSSEDPHIP